MNLIPTLFALDESEILRQYSILKSNYSHFHIDIMKSDYVFHNFFSSKIFKKLNKSKHTCEVHLMVKDIDSVLDEICSNKCVTSIIIHYEVFDNNNTIQSFVKSFKKNYPNILLQLGLDYETHIEEIFSIISLFDSVMVMGVKAGAQGQKLIKSQLKIIDTLNKLGVKTSIDGGVNNDTLKEIQKVRPNQINIGSYLNSSKTIKELELKINNLKSLKIIENNPVIICDIGGTYTKVFRGFIEDFNSKNIEIKETKSFKDSDEIISWAISNLNVKDIVLSVAGEKHENKISMTHQNLKFNSNNIKKKFKINVHLFNDCEISGYSLIPNFRNNHSLYSKSYLEILIILGTGLGMCHISSNKVIYNSQGGHIYTNQIDLEYYNYICTQLNKSQLTFDDILSANGLEQRFFYDYNMYKSSKEIIQLAFNEYSKYHKTLDFFLSELLLFIQDCIVFDNIVTQIHLGGEFLHQCLELIEIHFPKELKKLNSHCKINSVDTNYSQFLGAIEYLENH